MSPFKHEITAYNLLRFGILPGMGILIISLLVTGAESISLKVAILAGIPLGLGCLALSKMLASSPAMDSLNSESLAKAKYLRPSYILGSFVVVSIMVTVLHTLLGWSPDLILSLIMGTCLLVVQVTHYWPGGRKSAQAIPCHDNIEQYSGNIPSSPYAGYTGTQWPSTSTQAASPNSGAFDEEPRASYPEEMPLQGERTTAGER